VADHAADVAYRIAGYVTTNADAPHWSPHRWAHEAVSVILHDEGAAHDVLAVMHGRGQTAGDLAVVKVGDVPPWMEQVDLAGPEREYFITDDRRMCDTADVSLYVIKEADRG